MATKKQLREEIEELRNKKSELSVKSYSTKMKLEKIETENLLLKFIINNPPKYKVGHENNMFIITNVFLNELDFVLINAPSISKILFKGVEVLCKFKESKKLSTIINYVKEQDLKDEVHYRYSIFNKETLKTETLKEHELTALLE